MGEATGSCFVDVVRPAAVGFQDLSIMHVTAQ